MPSRVIENLSGSGWLWRGDARVCRVQYRVQVVQKLIPAGTFGDPDATLPGTTGVAGTITVIDGHMFDIFEANDSVLEFADGRRIEVLVTSWSFPGKSCRIVGNGTFF